MKHKTELEQQLLELHYGLFGGAEAAALRERIATEPDLAAAYDRVREKAGMFAAAARLAEPMTPLVRPEPATLSLHANSHADPRLVPGRRSEAPPLWIRCLPWVSAAAAAILVAVIGGRYWSSQVPAEELATKYPKITFTAPSKTIISGRENTFSFQVADANGEPLEAKMQYVVLGQNGASDSGVVKTDANGYGLLTCTPQSLSDVAVVQLALADEKPNTGIVAALPVEHEKLATYVTTDKPMYQPGEAVYFRSLSLGQFGLGVPREAFVSYEVRDPSGAVVAGSQLEGATVRGVGNGAFQLTPEAAGGEYRLFARSHNEAFPEVSRKFFVQQYRVPRFKKQLELTRDSYTLGDRVVANFSAVRAEGGAMAGASLKATATVDGKTVSEQTAKATDQGTWQVEFQLPEQIERGDAQLAVIVDDGGTQETIAKAVPVQVGKVDVQFYPEGGDLVAGVANGLYFQGRTPLGKPLHVAGTIVDAQDREVAKVETFYQGMGKCQFTPEAGMAYRLKVAEPKGIADTVALPAVAERPVSLAIEDAVCDSGKPIAIKLSCPSNDVPVIVTTACRGADLTAKTLTAAKGTTNVELPLDDAVSGVVRVSVFDANQTPPKPIAERLVYRRGERKLNVKLAETKLGYSPGESVRCELCVTDEKGQPTAAVLGVAVVDDSLLKLADDQTPNLATQFYLTKEVEKAEDLEKADFYLTDEPKAEQALDLLLGVQGWRRFKDTKLPEKLEKGDKEHLAEVRIATADNLHDKQLLGLATNAVAGGAVQFNETETLAVAGLPLTLSNGEHAAQAYASRLERETLQRKVELGQWGRGVFQIALLLGIAAILLALATRHLAPIARWTPALAMVLLCLALSTTWMNTSSDASAVLARADAAQQQMHRQDELQKNSQPTTRLAASVYSVIIGQDGTAYFNDLYDGMVALPSRKDRAVNGGRENYWGAYNFRGRQNENDVWRWKREPNAARFFALPALQGQQLNEFGIVAQRETLHAQLHFGRAVLDGDLSLNLFAHLPQKDRLAAGDGRYIRLREPFSKRRLGVQRAFGLNVLAAAAENYGFEWSGALGEELADWPQPQGLTVRQYAHVHQPSPDAARHDFTEMVYWNPLLIADAEGCAEIKFALSDNVTTFRVRSEAHDGAGRLGTGSGEVVSRIPFSLEPKLPLEVNAGDRIDLPIAVNNDTEGELAIDLALNVNDLLKCEGDATRKLTLAARQRAREFITLDVVGHKGQANVHVKGAAAPHSDAVSKKIRVVPPGFPVAQSYSGVIDRPQELTVKLPEDWVPGSLEVELRAYPDTLANLQGGAEGILREPHGCFEQASSANYPNLLSLQYMQQHRVAADPAVTQKAKSLLADGYTKLKAFESPKQGYEWFGADPGHEALTAYGLMEFRDMAQVYDVDSDMVTRTARWLLGRRDGKGGFERNAKALDSFGGAPAETTDAYIVWALTEAGEKDLQKEVDRVIKLGQESSDAYLVALAAAGAHNAGRVEAALELLKKLVKLQADDGRLEGKNSITRSGGLSLTMETTALAALAWMKTPQYEAAAKKAIDWIIKHREGSGGFGSTQATVLALKALVANAAAERKPVAAGSLVIKRGETKIGEQKFGAGESNVISIGDIAGQLTPGDNEVTISLTGENKMPYAMEIGYRTRLPDSDDNCAVRLTTALAAGKVRSGELVRLDAQLENTREKGQPMTVAILGLPAGLQPQRKQLDDLKKAGTIDYYELQAREVICYWRALAPGKKVDFSLDLVAEWPGRYTGPASRAYLYYTAEQKHWVPPLQVEIARPTTETK